jgi:hypothetical protein
MEVMRVTPGTIQSCVNVLKEGHVLGISPGKIPFDFIIRNIKKTWPSSYCFLVKILPR